MDEIKKFLLETKKNLNKTETLNPSIKKDIIKCIDHFESLLNFYKSIQQSGLVETAYEIYLEFDRLDGLSALDKAKQIASQKLEEIYKNFDSEFIQKIVFQIVINLPVLFDALNICCETPSLFAEKFMCLNIETCSNKFLILTESLSILTNIFYIVYSFNTFKNAGNVVLTQAKKDEIELEMKQILDKIDEANKLVENNEWKKYNRLFIDINYDYTKLYVKLSEIKVEINGKMSDLYSLRSNSLWIASSSLLVVFFNLMRSQSVIRWISLGANLVGWIVSATNWYISDKVLKEHQKNLDEMQNYMTSLNQTIQEFRERTEKMEQN